MIIRKTLPPAIALGIMAVALALPAKMTAAVRGPAAEEILRRVLTTVYEFPDVVSAEAEFRLRVKKPLSETPDCVFRGTVTVVSRHPTIKIDGRTAGLLCWAVDQYVLGRVFQPPERLESFLSRFEFDVLGEKLVGNDRYFLVAAKATDPDTRPGRMIVWIDFDRGLPVEGTIGYTWGSIDSELGYTRVENLWMLSHQYLSSARFGTSLDVHYSNFRFGAR